MQLELFSPNREPLAPPVSPKLAAAREEGERLKRQGMERAAWSKERLLGYARECALDIARGVLGKRKDGCVTADDVAAQLEAEKLPGLGNAAGSLFTGGAFEFTGRREKSKRPHAHQNELKVWKLKYP
jgi:hypothetical protein